MEQRFEQLLSKALRNKVTDIHFQLVEGNINVFMRGINGIIHLPTDEADNQLFNWLQYQAHLDITSNLPQSGSFTYFYRKRYYDFRFATLFTSKTRDGVLRILNCHTGLTLEEITKDKWIQKQMMRCLKKKSGLVLFTGLTGTGKTTTMYSLLQMIKGKSIYSLEDPIEVVQNNIVQLEINPKISFGYDEGITQILRHNPDILMIGEIRDETTAKMAVRAALTGTLVVSSLHARSTTSAIRRMLELNVNAHDLADVSIGIFNQQLCKQKGINQYICVFDFLNQEEVSGYIFGREMIVDNMQQRLLQAMQEGVIENEGDE